MVAGSGLGQSGLSNRAAPSSHRSGAENFRLVCGTLSCGEQAVRSGGPPVHFPAGVSHTGSGSHQGGLVTSMATAFSQFLKSSAAPACPLFPRKLVISRLFGQYFPGFFGVPIPMAFHLLIHRHESR